MYRCDYAGCFQAFDKNSRLERHKDDVHRRLRSFVCVRSGCSSSFAQKQQLEAHVATVHDGQRQFSCSVSGCNKSFVARGVLNRHIRSVHQDTRPFRCEYPGCDSAFKVKHHLVRHNSEAHQHEKEFLCQHNCPASFARKEDLESHVRVVHFDEKNYPCNFPACDFRAGKKGDLNRHFDAMHSEEARQRKKRQEEKVAKALDDAGIPAKREHQVDLSCWDDTFARADFVIVQDTCVILLEVDEQQHEWYGIECEVSRMTKIYAAFAIEGNTLPVLFIRYNPHAFRVDGELRKVRTSNRLGQLVQFIKKPPCCDGLTVLYMFYDCMNVDGSLSLNIWKDAAYNTEVRSCCRTPVI